ncbi:hypothetical protein VTI74DRAFT_2278 [Chaetomium olivicolor]
MPSGGASVGSSSHGRPWMLESLDEAASLSTTHTFSTASASGSAHEVDGDDDGGDMSEITVGEAVSMYHGLLQQWEGDEQDYEEEEEEYSEDYDEDSYGDDDVELYPPQHYLCPIHQQPAPHQSTSWASMVASLADEMEMSDDAGAPLTDYVNQILAAGMAGSTDGVSVAGFSSSEAGAPPNPGPETDQPAQVTTAAPFVAIAPPTPDPPPVPNLPDPPPIFDFSVNAADEQLPAGWFFGAHPFSISNPNPTTIGPSNPGLTDFLHYWAMQGGDLHGLARGRCPWPARVSSLETDLAELIKYDDLEGDSCDLQGVDWDDLGVTRRDARERRLLMYTNYVNIPGSDRWKPDLPDRALPRSDSFFRFRAMDIRPNIHLSHFQLRNVFASTSRSRVFYPTVGAVQQFNPMSGDSRPIMKFSDAPPSQISTLTASHGVLVAGGFNGEYILRHLDSGEAEAAACHEGTITTSISGITNHATVYQSRTSSSPLAAFASNDNRFRVLDLATEAWLAQEAFDFAPNCSALSPDGRLRVMVGDSLDVIITAAESSLSGNQPEILQRLSGHRDYGFACDWADDGWTVATAFQDKAVKIWDARRFTDSSGNAVAVHTLRSEMAGVRSLRFSPTGSGKRVLVAAEEADFVNIIDAQTFRSKQTVDVFGELGGISFADGGRELMVLCCDRTRGGVLQLERCGQGAEFEWDANEEGGFGHQRHGQRKAAAGTYDWPRSVFTQERRVEESSARRRRKVAAAGLEMEPF